MSDVARRQFANKGDELYYRGTALQRDKARWVEEEHQRHLYEETLNLRSKPQICRGPLPSTVDPALSTLNNDPCTNGALSFGSDDTIDPSAAHPASGVGIHEHLYNWKLRRDQKIENERTKKMKEESKSISFKPTINPRSEKILEDVPYLGPIRGWSVYMDHYLEKEVGRQLSRKLEESFRPIINSRSHDLDRNGMSIGDRLYQDAIEKQRKKELEEEERLRLDASFNSTMSKKNNKNKNKNIVSPNSSSNTNNDGASESSEPASIRIGRALYAAGMEKLARTEQRRKDALHEFSFQPKINENSSDLSIHRKPLYSNDKPNSKSTATDVEIEATKVLGHGIDLPIVKKDPSTDCSFKEFLARNSLTQSRKIEKVKKCKDEIERAILAPCTFTPQINDNSDKIAFLHKSRQSTAYAPGIDALNTDSAPTLYERDKKSRAVLEIKLAEERQKELDKQLRDASFLPKVNKGVLMANGQVIPHSSSVAPSAASYHSLAHQKKNDTNIDNAKPFMFSDYQQPSTSSSPTKTKPSVPSSPQSKPATRVHPRISSQDVDGILLTAQETLRKAKMVNTNQNPNSTNAANNSNNSNTSNNNRNTNKSVSQHRPPSSENSLKQDPVLSSVMKNARAGAQLSINQLSMNPPLQRQSAIPIVVYEPPSAAQSLKQDYRPLPPAPTSSAAMGPSPHGLRDRTLEHDVMALLEEWKMYEADIMRI